MITKDFRPTPTRAPIAFGKGVYRRTPRPASLSLSPTEDDLLDRQERLAVIKVRAFRHLQKTMQTEWVTVAEFLDRSGVRWQRYLAISRASVANRSIIRNLMRGGLR